MAAAAMTEAPFVRRPAIPGGELGREANHAGAEGALADRPGL